MKRGFFEKPWRTLGKIVGLIVTGVSLLWLVGANLFLAFGLRRIANIPDLTIDYDAAWTFWPGRVHVKGLSIRSQVNAVEWSVSATSASMSFDYFALLRREVYMPTVEATGLRYRMRLPVDPSEADASWVRALPPIAGLDDPPLALALAPTVPNPKVLWTAHIDDATAEVEEIWIEQVRWEGHAHVHTGFFLHPLANFQFWPTTLVFHDGALTDGPDEMLSGVEGVIRLSIAPFDPLYVDDQRIVRYVTGRVQLDAQVRSLEALKLFVDPLRGAVIEDGSGALTVDVSLEQGQALDGSSISYVTDRARIVARHLEAVAAIEARWAAEGDGTRARVALSNASVYRTGEKGPPVEITGARGEITTRGRDFGGPLVFERGAVDLGRVTARDLRWLEAYDEPRGEVFFGGGEGELTGHLDVDAALDVKGHLAALGRDVRGKLGEASFKGNAEAFVDLEGGLAKRQLTASRATVVLSKGRVDRGDHHRDLAGQIEIGAMTLGFRDGLALHATLGAATNDPLAVLDLLQTSGFIEDAAEIVAGDPLKARAELELRRGLLDVEITSLSTGALRGAGVIEDNGKHVGGAFRFAVGPLALGLRLDDAGIHPLPFVGEDWLEKNRPALTPNEPSPRASRTPPRRR